MERDNQRSRDEELYFFSASEPDSEWIPPAQGETVNLAKYSLKNAFKEVFGISKRGK
jgi:hypothetical protein